jgi:hypothetical protein
MQNGRDYPQILERWMNPDLSVYRHPPLYLWIGFFGNYLGSPFTVQTPWMEASLDTLGGGVGYVFQGDLSGQHWNLEFSQYVNAPSAPGVTWDLSVELGSGIFWDGYSSSPGNGFQFDNPSYQNLLYIDTVDEGPPDLYIYPVVQVRVRDYYSY